MTLHLLPDVIQGTDEWHDQRRGIVTASVVGQLLTTRAPGALEYACPECLAPAGQPCVSLRGGAPIKTLHVDRHASAATHRATAPRIIEAAKPDDVRALTLTLVAERITGHTDPTYLSDDMLRGMDDEPRAVAVYGEHHAPVETGGFMVRDDCGWKIGYSPDGTVGDDGLIEVKSRRQKKHLQTILADEVPTENMAQLQCGLLVSGRAWCDYVSYCGGMPLWVKRVEPDPRWFDAITAAVGAFEATAAQMIDTYQAATAGLPMTERAIELEMVI